jgi:hypothetical protein
MLPEVLFAGESLSAEKPATRNQRKICSSTPIRIAQPRAKWLPSGGSQLPCSRCRLTELIIKFPNSNVLTWLFANASSFRPYYQMPEQRAANIPVYFRNKPIVKQGE